MKTRPLSSLCCLSAAGRGPEVQGHHSHSRAATLLELLSRTHRSLVMAANTGGFFTLHSF